MADLLNRFDFYFSLFCAGLVLYLWARRWWRRFRASEPRRPAPFVYHNDYPGPPPAQTRPRPAPPPVLPPEPPPVPWQQYQVGAAQSVDFGAVLRFISETDITDEQAIA